MITDPELRKSARERKLRLDIVEKINELKTSLEMLFQ